MQLVNKTGQSANENERKLVEKIGAFIDNNPLERQKAVQIISLIKETYVLGRQATQNRATLVILSDMYPLLDALSKRYR